MAKTMTFLLASTALTIALGATAWSATRIMDDEVLPTAVQSQMDSRDLSPLIFVNDDDDEDDDDEGEEDDEEDEDEDDDDDRRKGARHEDDDDDDCDDDDDEACAGGPRNPAPAGSTAPPANGLFGNGAPPKAVTN
jgi:hypothetical protein